MKLSKLIPAAGLVAAALAAGPAEAATVNITANITPASPASLMHWTADNEYVLGTVIYVEAGVTLTIEPGTVVRGLPDADTPGVQDPGTLVITRGAKLYAIGTKLKPIIFTNIDDDNIGSNPGTNPYDTAANARGSPAPGVVSSSWVAPTWPTTPSADRSAPARCKSRG